MRKRDWLAFAMIAAVMLWAVTHSKVGAGRPGTLDIILNHEGSTSP